MGPLPIFHSLAENLDALVVLGCRVNADQPGSALLRRLKQAKTVHVQFPHLPVIMSGGRAWHGHTEAVVMARWWRGTLGEQSLASPLVEARSKTTRQNAQCVGRLCQELGYRHILLVTCDFHMARAKKLFQNQRLELCCVSAPSECSALQKRKMQLRERGARIADLLARKWS